jgi:hypothetical protein
MTIALENLPTAVTTKNAAMSVLDENDFALINTTVSANGLISTSRFALITGDVADQTELVVRHEYNAGANVTRVSVRFTTNGYDAALEEPLVGAYEALIAWNYPGKYPAPIADMTRLIQVVVGAVFPAFDGTTGVPDTSVVERLGFGITNNLAS